MKTIKLGILWLVLTACFLTSCVATPTSVEEGIYEEPVRAASMVVLGDNLMHMPVILDGKQEDGSFNYSRIFSKLREDIVNADLAVIGQETVLGGEEMGLSGYPMFNSPKEVGETLANEGFDVILHASNHIMDRGVKGIETSIDFWEGYDDITYLGINKSEEMKISPDIIEKNGIKFALFNYTYGTNGIPLPYGKEYMVNLLDEKKIEEDIKSVRDEVDFVVVFPHWGNEYWLNPSEEQKALALKMCEWGADAIIGSHPHVIEPCEWIKSENGNECVVFYSLGNFVSRQKETQNLLGGMAGLEFSIKGEEKTITARFTPIVTQYDYNSRNFVVYKLKDYTDGLAKLHGINLYDGTLSKAKFEGIFRKVFAQYPTNIDIEYSE